MARIDSYHGFSPIQVDFGSLYGVAKQEIELAKSKKREAGNPSVVKKKKKVKQSEARKDQIEAEKKQREKEERARREEAKRLEKIMSKQKHEYSDSIFRAENLPLKEAVMLAEIIGQPRCKSRYQRRGAR